VCKLSFGATLEQEISEAQRVNKILMPITLQGAGALSSGKIKLECTGRGAIKNLRLTALAVGTVE